MEEFHKSSGGLGRCVGGVLRIGIGAGQRVECC